VSVREPIGIVGTGLVGRALARALKGAGQPTVGVDRDVAALEAFAAAGGKPLATPAEVAARCTRIVVAVYDDDAARDVGRAMLATAQAGTVVVDVHTGSPEVAIGLAADWSARGLAWLDAPLSGSSAAIERREGVAMIGGEARAVAACAGLWPLVCGRHVHVGPAGSGQKAKLATNLVLGLNRAALAEGLALAEALGLDGTAFVDLLRITPAWSRAVDDKAARMLARDYLPAESRIAQHRKDLGLIAGAAAGAGQDLPLARAHAALLDAAIDHGDGALDNAAIVETLRRARAQFSLR
jgi:3-hydroxyisobutyrate dehydrogenase-like beta-hydroxyacid dehydrogenase